MNFPSPSQVWGRLIFHVFKVFVRDICQIMDVYNHVTDRERIDKEIAKLNEVQVM